MKKFFYAVSFLFLFSHKQLNAQTTDNPVTYMSQIEKAEETVSKKYISYMSTVSHGKSAKAGDKRRTDLINTIYEAKTKVNDMPSFSNDKSLRDASVSYLKLMYDVFNEDYAKIVNMEEIAEQSYDMMEAYLMAEEKAGEKLQEAGQKRSEAAKTFAAAHNVNLVTTKNEMSEKMEKIGKVSDYYHQVYLVFFKSSKQEGYLTEAVEKKDINGIEQNKNALLKYAEEGLAKLDTMHAFEADKTIVTSCKKALEFFKEEAGAKIAVTTDFLLKNTDFERLKKAMDAKPAKERTKQDVETYNKAVNDINKAMGTYNQTNQYLNTRRTDVYNNWNSTVQTFFDTHMPYAN
jgi:hypothetical protein